MTVISVTIGVALSLAIDGIINPLLYLLTLAGSVSIHAAANIINDYFDTKFGVDRPGAPTTIYRPHPVITGMLSENTLLKMSLFFVAVGLVIASYLSIVAGPYAFILGVIGVFIAVAYTSPPLSYKYRALGEVFVLLSWGPIMVVGSYYVQTSKLALIPTIVSIPFGLLVAAVLLANNMRDADYDASVNVKTIAIMLGPTKSLTLFTSMIATPYILTAIFVVSGLLSYPVLLIFATAPMALKLVKSFKEKIPETADPQTAQLATNFGIMYILGIIISTLL